MSVNWRLYCSSEKKSLALLQNEARANRNLKILEACRKLERTQVEKDYLSAKDISELTQASDVSVSNEVLRGLETPGQIKTLLPTFLIDAALCMTTSIQKKSIFKRYLLSRAPSSFTLDSQIDHPQIDQKSCAETIPINLNSNDEHTENFISWKPGNHS